MWVESSEQSTPLKTGLTTGTCATACSVASAIKLFGEPVPAVVSVTLPKGNIVELSVELESSSPLTARARTIKDAGDDPDITHGATVWAEVKLNQNDTINFQAGQGVGMVTKDGLLLSVGEPAINPVPRQMIIQNLEFIAKKYNYQGGFDIKIGVVNGEALALKTMNPKLGILGGLSILGTTGIVRPFSCAAWIASIYQGIDVAHANGITHIAASTGNASESAVKEKYQLVDTSLIEMGDFVGAVLKHLRKVPVPALTICGGFGKITKLANKHMDLHSKVSEISFEHLKDIAKNLGASSELQTKILNANTSIEALKLCQQHNINLAKAVCQLALAVCEQKIKRPIVIEIIVINRQGEIVGQAASNNFLEEL